MTTRNQIDCTSPRRRSLRALSAGILIAGLVSMGLSACSDTGTLNVAGRSVRLGSPESGTTLVAPPAELLRESFVSSLTTLAAQSEQTLAGGDATPAHLKTLRAGITHLTSDAAAFGPQRAAKETPTPAGSSTREQATTVAPSQPGYAVALPANTKPNSAIVQQGAANIADALRIAAYGVPAADAMPLVDMSVRLQTLNRALGSPAVSKLTQTQQSEILSRAASSAESTDASNYSSHAADNQSSANQTLVPQVNKLIAALYHLQFYAESSVVRYPVDQQGEVVKLGTENGALAMNWANLVSQLGGEPTLRVPAYAFIKTAPRPVSQAIAQGGIVTLQAAIPTYVAGVVTTSPAYPGVIGGMKVPGPEVVSPTADSSGAMDAAGTAGSVGSTRSVGSTGSNGSTDPGRSEKSRAASVIGMARVASVNWLISQRLTETSGS